MKPEPFDTASRRERATLIALSTRKQSPKKTAEYLEELKFLAKTADIDTIGTFTQRLEKPDIRTFIGQGKLEEVKGFVEDNHIDAVIFDDDLSPSQLRNLEKELRIKIFDRSLLILDIFLKRAKTSQAKTQVELARYKYLLPRLTRLWTHLERQRGGTGTRGGAGEKEIETDRRAIRNRISILEEKLEKIERQSYTRRKGREEVVRVALVGYTNVGKSTLMRLLSKADVFAEDKLFATVDSTVRKITWESIPFLLTDTVGFIRKLPVTLVECFKSTLDEIREADILLHVADISHPSVEEQIETVNSTLQEIGAADKPTILVMNKIDAYESTHEDDEAISVTEHLQNSWMGKNHIGQVVFISAEKRENIEELREVILKEVRKIHETIFPHYL